jgi:hypothetical protein
MLTANLLVDDPAAIDPPAVRLTPGTSVKPQGAKAKNK